MRRAFLLFAAGLLGGSAACASPQTMLVPIDGAAELYVRERGEGSTAIVVPGASWLEEDMTPLVRGHHTIFYDPRGRGRSSPADEGELSLERDVADLETLRASLSLERMTLLGWAYNAGLILHYALAHPERVERLVLIAALPPRRTPYWEEYTRAFLDRTEVAAMAKLERMRETGARERDPYAYCRLVTEAFLRATVHDFRSAARMKSDPCVRSDLNPDATARRGQRIVAALGDWDWTDALGELEVPTLLVHGREDPLSPASSELYATLLPDARLLLLDASGHLPWIERPDAFFPAVLEFIVDPGPANPATQP